MPIYEYQCGQCDQQFELLVRSEAVPACPHCGSVHLEKLLSAVARPSAGTLPITGGCPPSDAPPCGPGCCRLP